MMALDSRPLPIAFGGPGAITVAGTRQPQARRQRRRECAAGRGGVYLPGDRAEVSGRTGGATPAGKEQPDAHRSP